MTSEKEQALRGNPAAQAASVNWTRRQRAATVVFRLIVGVTVLLGAAELAGGYPPQGLTSLGVAWLIAVIGALVRLNWRILETNADLIRQNRWLLEERHADLMRRIHGGRWSRKAFRSAWCQREPPRLTSCRLLSPC